MSNLVSNYEISVWKDVFQTADQTFQEQKICVIGAPDLPTQSRAMSPHFKRGVNGTNELNFEMYYRYVDNITGEEVNNHFVQFLTNETKLKLKHKDKWYDFIIKNISEDSVNKIFKYQAIDYHVNELSKNGYGLTLDIELENNIGTIEELGNRIFAGTGWEVDADVIPQKTEEALIKIKFTTDATFNNVYHLDDSESIAPDENFVSGDGILEIPQGKSIYVFYSTLKEGKDRFQFIYSPTIATFDTKDRVIQNKACQYYIDNVTYSEPVTGTPLATYKFKYPDIFDNKTYTTEISSEYRGERFVFSHKQIYNPILKRYVTEYKYVDDEGEEQKVHEYTTTDYESPILISNLITNTNFKSNTGWTGQYYSDNENDKNKVKSLGAKREVKTSPDIWDSIDNLATQEYIPYLNTVFQSSQSVLVNSGIFDNRKKIENFSAGEQYVLMWRSFAQGNPPSTFDTENILDDYKVVVADHEYSVEDNCYIENGTVYLDFSAASTQGRFYTKKSTDSNSTEYVTYGFAIASIPNSYALSKLQFQSKKIQIFIQPTGLADIPPLNLLDLQLFPYKPNGKNTNLANIYHLDNIYFITPESQPTDAKIITTYYYFDSDSDDNKNASNENQMIITSQLTKRTDLSPSYIAKAEKTVTLSIQQSNYFNAAQSLAETAQCWVEFVVEHDEDGNIVDKTVYFQNDIQQQNYAGFRYGVNLRGIQRTLNSQAIVTKLIVPDVVNEFSDNGFCSIQRAKSNETGENVIYDFSYYVRQNLLDYNAFWSICYDLDKHESDDDLYGYYFRLKDLNDEIRDLSTTLNSFTIAKLQAQADLQIATSGKIKAAEEYETSAIDFLKLTGHSDTDDWVEDNKDMIKESDSLSAAYEKCVTLKTAYRNFVAQEASAQATVNSYLSTENEYNTTIDSKKEAKKSLNTKFYETYRRFIQEGTWNKPESTDDEKYYLEAKSVAFTSAQPQVAYQISVMSLEGVEGYENFTFDLADLTFIEDEEYFGYDEKGNPYREEVFLTEINYYLDEPDKTSITVQNFKNKFQDLFQRITATVQTVNYASGAWQSAADFMQSNSQSQATFITEALNNAETVLQNAGEQSVIIDSNGITVTDLSSADQKLRIVGGAIMLGTLDEGGQEKWSVGMTAQGINAKNITAGTLNTGEIIIMNGVQPSFRWDGSGLTAYDFEEEENAAGEIIRFGFNYNKGVRFDRFGIYGYDEGLAAAIAAANEPLSLDIIKQNSMFALTWDGLFLKLGSGIYTKYMDTNGEVQYLDKGISHKSNTILGRTNELIYNSWNGSAPYLDTNKKEGYFTKIFAVGNGVNNESLVIYDNGLLVADNIKLVGDIVWTDASSPAKTVYATSDYIKEYGTKPTDGTKYKDFPEKISDTGIEEDGTIKFPQGYWHQEAHQDDSYYATTSNGGATWQGPFLISGKSIQDTVVVYAVDNIGADPTSFADNRWDTDFPVSVSKNQCVYKKKYYLFNNNTTSTPEYEVSYVAGPNGISPYSIEVENDTIIIPADDAGNTDDDAVQAVSEMAVFVKEGKIDITEQLYYEWLANPGDKITIIDSENEAYIQKINQGTDSGTITVTIYTDENKDTLIGTKVFTVSKNKQGIPGTPAIGYQFVPSINQINKDESIPDSITFTVYRVEGAEKTNITSDYQIKIGNTSINNPYNIDSNFTTTTFTLYVDGTEWDSKTISVVDNGKDAIRSYIESPNGNLFCENDTGTITLIARIYIGNTEIDPLVENASSLQKLQYKWYAIDNDGEEINLGTGKKIEGVSLTAIRNKTIYFEAS